ncbi:MAG: TonB-dependent receptor, partial [Propionivibrio sp.]|nr:TonB-dependent receptor [Propionivibrio sp.]
IWDARQAGTYTASTRYVGKRRYGSDFANAQGCLSGYTTLDLQGAWDLKPWTITAKVMNALDKKYSPFAGYSSSRSDTYYYPADGRSFFISGRYDF